MPPAARITDMHTCPMVTGVVPHVGGPIVPPGAPTVLVNFLPAANVTTLVTCVGPPDIIAKGSTGVFLNYMPAARLGDLTAHGGVIVMGSPNVMIGEIGSPMPGFAGLNGVTSGMTMSAAAPPPKKPGDATDSDVTVVSISGTLAGTHGLRTVNAHKQLPTKNLTPSRKDSEDLTENAPVVLMRGCKDVHLTAATTPAHKPVTWEVKPNENSNAAPAITQTGPNTATLATGQTGSFSVIATSGDSKVVWNVVFVSVEVDVSTTKPRVRKTYTGSMDGGWLTVSSGVFTRGQQAWEATVTVNLVGGGSDGRLGVNRVRLSNLQNGVDDTLTGNYAPPPANSAVIERVRGGFPVQDSMGTDPTDTDAMVFQVDNSTAPRRSVWMGDSPAGSFLPARSDPANGGKLMSVSGLNAFKTAVASVSMNAPNEIMAHAEIRWWAHFDGTVDASGAYTRTTAHTVSQWFYKLLSPETGGQDAHAAGYEVFGPRFNHDAYRDPAP